MANQAEKNPEDPQLLSLINLTAVAVRRMIKMVKKINAFKNMCQEDQVALLKGSCTEMMILRSIMQYDVDHSTWKIPHSQGDMSNIKSEVLKLASNNVYATADSISIPPIMIVMHQLIGFHSLLGTKNMKISYEHLTIGCAKMKTLF